MTAKVKTEGQSRETRSEEFVLTLAHEIDRRGAHRAREGRGLGGHALVRHAVRGQQL